MLRPIHRLLVVALMLFAPLIGPNPAEAYLDPDGKVHTVAHADPVDNFAPCDNGINRAEMDEHGRHIACDVYDRAIPLVPGYACRCLASVPEPEFTMSWSTGRRWPEPMRLQAPRLDMPLPAATVIIYEVRLLSYAQLATYGLLNLALVLIMIRTIVGMVQARREPPQ